MDAADMQSPSLIGVLHVTVSFGRMQQTDGTNVLDAWYMYFVHCT